MVSVARIKKEGGRGVYDKRGAELLLKDLAIWQQFTQNCESS